VCHSNSSPSKSGSAEFTHVTLQQAVIRYFEGYQKIRHLKNDNLSLKGKVMWISETTDP
jgi:hypothetical protein